MILLQFIIILERYIRITFTWMKDYSYEFRAPDGTSQNLGADNLYKIFLIKIIIAVDISNYVGNTSKPLVETTHFK